MNNDILLGTPEVFLADSSDAAFKTKNTANYKLLVDNWNANRCVSFVGAGASSPLDIDGWTALIKYLQDIVEKRYGKKIEINENDLPLTAENLFKEFELNKREADFDDIIFSKMDPRHNSTTLTMVKLALLLNVHITTNFDISINNAYTFLNHFASYFRENKKTYKDVCDYSLPKLPNYYQISKSNSTHIIYLHGKKGGAYIFRVRDYDKFYPSLSCGTYSKCIEDCLKAFFKETSFLFFGFSFKDVRLKKMIFKVISEIKRDVLINEDFIGMQENGYNLPRHYLLTADDKDIYGNLGWDDFYREFEQYNIYPIMYQKEKHIFLEHLFDYFLDQGRI